MSICLGFIWLFLSLHMHFLMRIILFSFFPCCTYFVSWFVYVIVIVIAIAIAILPLPLPSPLPCIAIAIAIATVIIIILFLFIIFVCQTLDCAKHENRPVRDGQTRGQVDDYTDDPQRRPVGAWRQRHADTATAKQHVPEREKRPQCQVCRLYCSGCTSKADYRHYIK